MFIVTMKTFCYGLGALIGCHQLKYQNFVAKLCVASIDSITHKISLHFGNRFNFEETNFSFYPSTIEEN